MPENLPFRPRVDGIKTRSIPNEPRIAQPPTPPPAEDPVEDDSFFSWPINPLEWRYPNFTNLKEKINFSRKIFKRPAFLPPPSSMSLMSRFKNRPLIMKRPAKFVNFSRLVSPARPPSSRFPLNFSVLSLTLSIFVVMLALAGLVSWWQKDKITPEEFLETTVVTDDTKLAVNMSFQLEIIILGQKQAIPNTFGQAPGGRLILNTDNDNGQIRIQSPTKRDYVLADFFTLWGAPFTSQCIFSHCASGGNRLTMTVNDQPNTEFDQYLIRPGDRIKIVYE